MKHCAVLAVLAGLFGAGVGQAQTTIKLKERGEGESALVKRNDTTTSRVTVTDATGKVLTDVRDVKTDILEYKEKYLKREAGKLATKLERDYIRAQSGKDDKLEDSPLKDKIILIEKKDTGYVFTYKNGDSVEGHALAALNKDFGKKNESNAELEKLVLPGKAVLAGDSWKIDMPKVVMLLGKPGEMELDGDKSTGQGTLVKVYKKDGMQFGVMKFKLEMPILTIGKDKGLLKFEAGAKIAMDLTFDVCIDGKSEAGTLKMKMVMSGDATIPAAPSATATMKVTADTTQIQADATKQ